MKLCTSHWDALREAIDKRGLTRLVGDSRSAMQVMKKGLDGTLGPDDFDPLLAANNMIWGNALQAAGLDVMANNDDGSERCPICHMNAIHLAKCAEPEKCDFSFDTWIDRAADDAADIARKYLPYGDAL